MKPGSLLVTGANGFVGRVLVPYFRARGWRVTGLIHPADEPSPSLEGETFRADLSVAGSLDGLSREWDAVIHLAAISVPSEVDAAGLLTNVRMTTNLLDHVLAGTVVVVSSCLVYAPSDHPLAEDAALGPAGKYGLSKVLVEALATHYRRRLDVRVARPFNHVGRGMPAKLMIPSLVRRVSEIRPGEDLIMRGFNSTRDFIDVRDVVHAYESILGYDESEPWCFNVCSGSGRSVEDVAQALLRLARRDCAVTFESRATSSDDVMRMVGDHSRLSRCTGWEPRYALDETLREIWSNS